MFPLGSVLVPGMPLPLHVFEERYRTLVKRCLEHETPFGVTLIERGGEVGGGDTRFGIGCLARIVDAHRFTDGRFAIVAVGTERIKVAAWLEDDPYPQAETVPWPDEGGAITAGAVEMVRAACKRALALAAEIGVGAAPATTELSDDPEILAWQVAAGAPLASLDRLRLLAAPGVGERLDLAAVQLREAVSLLEMQLASDSEDPSWDLPPE